MSQAMNLASELQLLKIKQTCCIMQGFKNFFLFFMVLPGMTQLTRKSPIALRLILRGSPGPMA